jgi:hypothetical protein
MHASPIPASQMSATEQYEALASNLPPQPLTSRSNHSEEIEKNDPQSVETHPRQQDFGAAGERAA